MAKSSVVTEARSHTFRGLSPSTEYRFGIVPINKNPCNQKAYGPPSSATGTTDAPKKTPHDPDDPVVDVTTTRPPKVFGLSLTSTASSVSAKWNDLASGRADQYLVRILEGLPGG